MALLLWLLEKQKTCGYALWVLHVEHGIRGEESRQDALFVEALCRRLGVPVKVAAVDAPALAKKEGLGLEEAARILRHRALQEEAKRLGAVIALAHHREDAAETMLFQLVRGSGLRGLRAMEACRVINGLTYIRPLLYTGRPEIEAWLRDREQAWREDSSNGDDAYSRNLLRNQVMPLLRQINRRAEEHMLGAGEQIGLALDLIEQEADRAFRELVTAESGRFRLEIPSFLLLHPALQSQLLFRLLEEAAGQSKDLTETHVRALYDLTLGQSGRRIDLPCGLGARREFDHLILERGKQDDWGTICWEIREFDGNLGKNPNSPCNKWVDYDRIENGPCIRTRRPGDYLIMDEQGHRKSLKKYLIELQVPAEARESMPLLADGDCVIYVPGGRISENYKVTADTARIAVIQYMK